MLRELLQAIAWACRSRNVVRRNRWRQERADVAAYDAARASGETPIPFELALAEIEREEFADAAAD